MCQSRRLLTPGRDVSRSEHAGSVMMPCFVTGLSGAQVDCAASDAADIVCEATRIDWPLACSFQDGWRSETLHEHGCLAKVGLCCQC